MAISFPSNPTLNQTYTYGGTTWYWNSSSWSVQSQTLTNLDANTLDGLDSSYILNYNNLNNKPNISLYAPIASPSFTGTATFSNVSGITSSMVGLGNVTNESKTTLFNNSVLTGHPTIEGITSTGSTGTGNIVYASGPSLTGMSAFGLTSFGVVSESMTAITGATGVVVHDCSSVSIFYHTGIAGSFTPNFTNVQPTLNKVTSVSLILNQGGSGYYPTALQINGVAQTIRWVNNGTPTAGVNKVDLASFNLISTSTGWIVIGTYISYA
jgi:hypothetical protein